jgi:hypothetical protein
MPLAMPGKTKVLKNIPTRHRQLFNAAGNAGQNKVLKNIPTRRRQLFNAAGNAGQTKFLKINRRDAVSFCFRGLWLLQGSSRK